MHGASGCRLRTALASLRDPVAQLVTSVATIGLIGGIIAPFGAAWLLIKKVPGVSQTL
jgi:hypothetical protein